MTARGPQKTYELENLKILPQLFFPIRHMESSCLEPGEVEGGVMRARRDGPLGARVIIGSTQRDDLIAIAVGSIEDRTSNFRPALNRTRADAVISLFSA